jgi:tetratricopeptide (TPR) repeat protein
VEASSFIQFLCDRYGTAKFKKFYQEVTDLTFDQFFEKIYSKNLTEMESEWLSFLDGYDILYDNLIYFANIKFNYNDFGTVIPIFEDLLNMASSQKESLNALQALGNSYYMSGRYQEALSFYQKKSSYYPEDPQIWNTLGNVYYLLGDFEPSKGNYHKAKDLDTNYADPWISLGRLHLYSAEYDSAQFYFDRAEKKDVGLEGIINLNLGKAKIHKISGDPLKSEEKAKQALDFSRLFLSQVPERAVPYLKVGESFLSLGFPDSALAYLELAEFLENRPFYQGELFLNLGKAHLLTGEDDLAQFYFRKILETPSAETVKQEAQRLLDEPR